MMRYLLPALLLAGCAADTAPVATAPAAPAEALAISTTPAPEAGVVAAANPLAVDAGLEVLRRGGSAVDAAATVQFALGLVEPQSSGLGGGAFMVVYDSKTGEVWTYDGRETAPSDVDSKLFQNEDGEPVRYLEGIVSGRSTGAPGAVAMLGLAHEDYGLLPWSELVDPVLPLAKDGFAVSPRLASLLQRAERFNLPNDGEAGALYYPDGEPLEEGELLMNPAYASTLRAIAEDSRAMLQGPVAESIAAKVREEPRPGTLSVADMAAYQPVKKEALCVPYRDVTVCGAQPPASGTTAIGMALGILETFDMSALGPTPRGWHVFIEASRLAYADRDAYLSAPESMTVTTDALLDPDRLRERARLIKTDSVMTEARADSFGAAAEDATPDSPGTSHFTVVDRNGLVVSMTTTVESVFGSQRMVGGFILNNQLTDFSFRDTDDAGTPIPNRVAPGKRPRSSMSPTIVFDSDGEWLLTTGSPGGNSIIAYTLKTLVGVVDWGLEPQAAADLPNVIARGDTVRIEEGAMSEATVEALREMGHEVALSEGEISGIHMLMRRDDGTVVGAADSRREGKVGRE